MPVRLLALACLLLASPSSAAEPPCGTERVEPAWLLEAPGAWPADLEGFARAKSSHADGSEPECLPPEHVWLFEDEDRILLEEGHSFADLRALYVDAANEVIAAHGDRFDFFTFFTNFEPAWQVGGAHYSGIRNDVTGIGLPLYDSHASLGLEGAQAQGFINMYDFHLRNRKSGRNALVHEYGHRWLSYLDPLLDGRSFGNGHFGCAVDAQGGVHLAEWAGENPAHGRGPGTRNWDTGSSFGWLILYLMGLADGAEMDASMSEQRYLDDIDQAAGDCLRNYRGGFSAWSSADLVASNGERVPAPEDSQRHFRTAWILIHAPGEPPSFRDLRHLTGMAEGLHEQWNAFTLGRGTMRGHLFEDADCDGTAD
jgi:hypothetical protein